MASLTSHQLCNYYLDGNFEAAFEIFEYAGPHGLREFMGLADSSEAIWKQVYGALIADYGFLMLLAKKYPVTLRKILLDQGSELFRKIFEITDSAYDAACKDLLDELFQGYMQDVFRGRRRSHIGTFFISLRNLLRGEVGL